MKVTYITHSCFLIESGKSFFLFDYFDGELPPISDDKPLYCFASHSHGDHFSPKLFEATLSHPTVYYILSDDISKKALPAEAIPMVYFMPQSSRAEIGNITVKTLKSTDMGVAFVIEEDGKLIYHAGDLNNWQWDEESPDYNTKMEKAYISQIKKLKGLYFTIAFIPLDPRQTPEARKKGIKIFTEYASAKNIFPMHMWDKYDTPEIFADDLNIMPLLRCTDRRNKIFDITEE